MFLRFSPEKKINQLTYMPFGLGPRNCIGMRFALLEIKLTLVKVLRKFNVFPSENTPKTLSFVEGIVRRPKNGISVTFGKRNMN